MLAEGTEAGEGAWGREWGGGVVEEECVFLFLFFLSLVFLLAVW